jgi:HJR/Mrr/RecB family endonuclease
MLRRGQTTNPLLSLVALGGLIALLVRLGALWDRGALAVVLASAALVTGVILTSLLRSITRPLAEARRIRRLGLAEIDEMDGTEFEEYVCRLLEHRGFQAALTGGSDDRGVDIVAEREAIRCAVQVKRHWGMISRHAVSDAVGGMRHYDCNAAMVVTNSYFTESAVALAESNDCALVDREVLQEWMVDFRDGSLRR